MTDLDRAWIAALAALIAVLVAAALNRISNSSSWIREERLRAYENYSESLIALQGDPSDPDKIAHFKKAHTQMLLLATLRQDYSLRAIQAYMNFCETRPEQYERVRREVNDFEEVLFDFTRLALVGSQSFSVRLMLRPPNVPKDHPAEYIRMMHNRLVIGRAILWLSVLIVAIGVVGSILVR